MVYYPIDGGQLYQGDYMGDLDKRRRVSSNFWPISLTIIALLTYLSWDTKFEQSESARARLGTQAEPQDGANAAQKNSPELSPSTPISELTGEQQVNALIAQVEEEFLTALSKNAESSSEPPDLFLKMIRFPIPDEKIGLNYTIEKTNQNEILLQGTIRNPSARFAINRAVFDLKIFDCVNATCNQVNHSGVLSNLIISRNSDLTFKLPIDIDPTLIKNSPKAELTVAANWALLDPATIAEDEAEMALLEE